MTIKEPRFDTAITLSVQSMTRQMCQYLTEEDTNVKHVIEEMVRSDQFKREVAEEIKRSAMYFVKEQLGRLIQYEVQNNKEIIALVREEVKKNKKAITALIASEVSRKMTNL